MRWLVYPTTLAELKSNVNKIKLMSCILTVYIVIWSYCVLTELKYILY